MSSGTIDELELRAPAWLTTSETYGHCAAPWEQILASKWRFVTHTPCNREYLGALRSVGRRGFPYMTFYQTHLTCPHQGVRMSEHTDWLEIDEHGHWKRTGFWDSEDAKNMYCTCANTAGYRESLLACLQGIMESGAGGIFLDNVHPGSVCHGEEFGIHKHLYPTQQEAFASLMREARALIRRYDPEGALLVNSADPVTLPEIYWPWVDSEMAESFICTWVSTDRWGDWPTQWNGMDRKLAKWLRLGKQVLCLSYVGWTQHTLKDDCFFTYASARLMNMIWQAGCMKVHDDPECNILYQIETGQPVAEEQVSPDGVHYRLFAHALVAVNPTDRDAKIAVSHCWPTSLLRDLHAHESLSVNWLDGATGVVTAHVPAQSGRVYLFEPALDELVHPEIDARYYAAKQYTLTIATDPPLGKTRFLVDGTPLWTCSGRWTTKYELGPNYGACQIDFDGPGEHVVELLDTEKKALLVSNSYVEAIGFSEQLEIDAAGLEPGESPRLGRMMDPSNPTQFLDGDGYAFDGWAGSAAGTAAAVTVRVDAPTTVVARFRRL